MSTQLVNEFKPRLLQSSEHELCPGCGHPVAMRVVLEVVEELGPQAVLLAGHGCYTQLMVHQRSRLSPVPARPGTGRSDRCEAHAPAHPGHHPSGRRRHGDRGPPRDAPRRRRGENFTGPVCSTTESSGTRAAISPPPPSSASGPRPASKAGTRPCTVTRSTSANCCKLIDGAAYVARGAVNAPGMIARTKRMVRRALELQVEGARVHLRRGPYHVSHRVVRAHARKARSTSRK